MDIDSDPADVREQDRASTGASTSWPLCTLGFSTLAGLLGTLSLKDQPDTVHDLVDACAAALKAPAIPGQLHCLPSYQGIAVTLQASAVLGQLHSSCLLTDFAGTSFCESS